MKLTLEYRPSWVMDPSGHNQFAVPRTVKLLRRHFGPEHFRIVYQSTFELTVMLDDRIDDQALADLVLAVREKITGTDVPFEDVCRMRAEGAESIPKTPDRKKKLSDTEIEEGIRDLLAQGQLPEALPQDTSPEQVSVPQEAAKDPDDGDRKPPEADRKDAARLIGRQDFDALCADIRRRAPVIRADGTEYVFSRQAYLFAVNTGDGYSTCLSRLSALLKEEKLYPSEREPWEFRLPEPDEEHLPEKMADLLEQVRRVSQTPRLVSFDLEPWLGRTARADFKRFLLTLVRHATNIILFFRIPYAAAGVRDQVLEDLRDLFRIRVVLCPPYEGENAHRIADRVFSEFGFAVEDEAWNRFDDRMEEEKLDGHFYGIHTIDKVAGEMITLAEGKGEGREVLRITGEAVQALTRGEDRREASMNQLKSMVGLASVKREIPFIVNQILLARTVEGMKAPGMHMLFEGNPGTGKTTVARIIAGILKEKGVLRSGRLYEHHGRDLCGRYVGETAIKTNRICEEAYGSVLFIDEAYSLFRGEFGSNDFGREALDALVAQMENHSDELCVILAGYPEDMKTLLSANSGLASRIPYRIVFPDYTRNELHKIFGGMVQEHFTLTDELNSHTEKFFEGLPEEKLHAKDFGNGRYVRNLYERAWGLAAEKNPGKKLTDVIITPTDFDEAVKDVEGAEDKKIPKFGYVR